MNAQLNLSKLLTSIPALKIGRGRSLDKRRSNGFTLTEILVTLVIMSVGLLGVAGLHSISLRNNFDALIRSHASALASDIADRMRANRTRALAGEYDIAIGAKRDPADKTQSSVDLIEWKTRLAAQLPNGDGSITRAAAPSRLFTITIQWGERDVNNPVITFTTQTEI